MGLMTIRGSDSERAEEGAREGRLGDRNKRVGWGRADLLCAAKLYRVTHQVGKNLLLTLICVLV